MQTTEPTSEAEATGPSPETMESEPSLAWEVLDLQYGPGGFFPLDSDDIEAMVATGQVSMPPTATSTDGNAPPAEPAPRKAA